MTDYEFKCHKCGKLTIRNNLDFFQCLCELKPLGLKYYHHCLTCNSFYWGSSQPNCTQCIASSLSEKKVTFEPFGDMKNVPRRNPDREQNLSELAHEKVIEAKKQAQLTRDLAERSTIETAQLLRDLNEKMSMLLKREEFEC